MVIGTISPNDDGVGSDGSVVQYEPLGHLSRLRLSFFPAELAPLSTYPLTRGAPTRCRAPARRCPTGRDSIPAGHLVTAPGLVN